MKAYSLLLVLMCGGLLTGGIAAQDDNSEEEVSASPDGTTEEAEHEALRELRDALTEAVLSGDVESQLALADENVVTTWQNNRVARGHDGLQAFLNEMNGGAEKVFQGYTVPPTADELTILHGGDTGVVYGTSVPHYKLLGMEFDLENRWTATVVKDDDQWKIAAYHVSANILDNPVLTAAKKSTYWAAGIAFLVGLLAGCFGGRFLKKKPASEG